MGTIVALLICVAGALALQIMYHAYFYLPKKELKRRDEPVYKKLRKVADYQTTARVFLTFFLFIFAASAVIVAGRALDPLAALIFLAVFALLLKKTSSKDLNIGNKLAAAAAPAIAKILYYIDPLADLLKDIRPKRKKHQTTDIYETEDLQEFIRHQQKASNNRISADELTSALNALEFGSKKIKDYMTPKNRVHFVSAKDTVGPILLSELHKTGLTCFPVKGNSENEVEGLLYLENLVKLREGGVVSQAMETKVFYINQAKPLEEVLQAFTKTGQHEFMVINSETKITGMVNLKKVLEQMTGHSEKSDFDDYDDPSAVSGS